MVERIQDVIGKYEERVQSMENVPKCSNNRRMLRSDGGPNRSFFFCLFSDVMATEFLKEIGLLRKTMQCDSCGRDMTWSVRSKIHDGFIWRCQRRVAGAQVRSVYVHQARVMVPAE